MGSSGTKKLGLFVGHGRLPLLVAESARARGYEVLAFGFKGMMDEGLKEIATAVYDFPFCNLGAVFDRIEKEGIKEAVTIGGIAQTSVLEGMPQFDELALSLWKRLPDRRVDSIMEILIDVMTERGIEIAHAISFLTDHLAPGGGLTRKKASDKQWEDIRFGFRMAKAIGGLDIGQTVVAKHRAIRAVEAVEGTDRAILRGGELAQGGAVVVKVAKPGQDMRYDVPAVGMETVKAMQQTKSSVLAVETDKVLMVEREDMIAYADKKGIAIVGVSEEEAGEDG